MRLERELQSVVRERDQLRDLHEKSLFRVSPQTTEEKTTKYTPAAFITIAHPTVTSNFRLSEDGAGLASWLEAQGKTLTGVRRLRLKQPFLDASVHAGLFRRYAGHGESAITLRVRTLPEDCRPS